MIYFFLIFCCCKRYQRISGAPQVGNPASNCAHFSFFKIFSSFAQNPSRNTVFQRHTNLFILTDGSKNRVTVATKHDKSLELASLHWACIFLVSASPPVRVVGCSVDRSPVLWLLEHPVATEGERRMSKEVTTEQSGIQGIGNWPTATFSMSITCWAPALGPRVHLRQERTPELLHIPRRAFPFPYDIQSRELQACQLFDPPSKPPNRELYK